MLDEVTVRLPVGLRAKKPYGLLRGGMTKRGYAAKQRKELAGTGRKACYKCAQVKALEDFYENKNCSDGRTGRCIECHGRKRRQTRRKRDTGVTQLYRHFDEGGRLLYVGISLSVAARLASHNHLSQWSSLIRRIDVSVFPDRKSAEYAETLAIQTESPIYNIMKRKAA